jgi:pimeloyl-ACP methyl ester carboxylesterase
MVFGDVKTATVNGATLAYCAQGEGEPVVFVHGSGSDLRTWERQLPVIGRSYRAISYSRRFARPNEDIDPDVDDQMQPHVEDLTAFLRELDAAPAHLVGNSWGAFICLLTAVQHPDVVRTLVLEEPPVLSLFVSTPPRPMELLRLFVTRPRTAAAIVKFGVGAMGPAQQAFRRGDDETAMLTFGRGVLGAESLAQLPEARATQMRENLGTVRAQLLGAGFPPLRDEEVRDIRVPTMLVTGARSPAVLLRLTDRLEELLPMAERVEIAGASHLMHEENAAALNEALVGFLCRHRTGSTS